MFREAKHPRSRRTSCQRAVTWTGQGVPSMPRRVGSSPTSSCLDWKAWGPSTTFPFAARTETPLRMTGSWSSTQSIAPRWSGYGYCAAIPGGRMKSLLTIVVATLFAGLVVLALARPAASAPPQATADTLKQLEGEFMKSAAEKGSAGIHGLLRRRCRRSAQRRPTDSR